MALMLLYLIERPKMLLIDDVESHMNPLLMTFLAEWLADIVRKDGVILVVSTHSIEATKLLADTLSELNPRIIITSLHNGELTCRSLSAEELEELEHSGMDVRLAQGILL